MACFRTFSENTMVAIEIAIMRKNTPVRAPISLSDECDRAVVVAVIAVRMV
jgi:hypothetical protein